ncbi:hypothetical protein FRC08_017375 [Ceratobasidium sp. 394]|nr:hypothetical protein FRC08_017375 [Ceratobasidium sp. 394]
MIPPNLFSIKIHGTLVELSGATFQICSQRGDTQTTRLDGDKTTILAMLAAFETHDWTHFTSHASQDTSKPTANAFYLHNGPLNRETITMKQLKDADLVFLSACQTATGNENMREQVVHFAAGMTMARFRRVVRTMWSIDDEDASLVAERFYAYMLQE